MCQLNASKQKRFPYGKLPDQGEHPTRRTVVTDGLDGRPASIQPAGGAATMMADCGLQCPRCGRDLRGWFAMNRKRAECGRLFDRAPGYLLGSIYFNYGVTALLVVIVYFSLYFSETLTGKQLLVLLMAFSVVFPLWFFRRAGCGSRSMNAGIPGRTRRRLGARRAEPGCDRRSGGSLTPWLLFGGVALGLLYRAVTNAAECGEDDEGHRHHKEDAVVVAGGHRLAVRVVLGEPFAGRWGTRWRRR